MFEPEITKQITIASHTVLHILTAVLLGPLIPGIINKTKALVAGRCGPPVLQLYYDLAKLWDRMWARRRRIGAMVIIATLLTAIVAFLVPVALGLNVSLMVQLVPAATLAPPTSTLALPVNL